MSSKEEAEDSAARFHRAFVEHTLQFRGWHWRRETPQAVLEDIEKVIDRYLKTYIDFWKNGYSPESCARYIQDLVWDEPHDD